MGDSARFGVSGGQAGMPRSGLGDLDDLDDSTAPGRGLILSGGNLPRSRLHLAYVALDGIKVVLLPVLGVVLVTGAAS
jgi:hypothetical protein